MRRDGRVHRRSLGLAALSAANDKMAPLPDDATGREWLWRVMMIAWPIVLSNLTLPIVGAVDTAVVGHLDDARWIGGVALGTLIFNYIYWGFGFLRMGTTGFVAQAFGAKDRPEVRATLGRAILLSVLFGLGCVVFREPLTAAALWVLGGSEGVEEAAYAYVIVRIWAAPAALCNISMLGWFFGLQRSGAGLIQQSVINGVNVVLNLVFVFQFGWGIEGVALASVVAQYVGLAVGVVLVRRIEREAGPAVPNSRTWPVEWSRIFDLKRLRPMFAVNIDIFIRTVSVATATGYFLHVSATLGDGVLAANAVLQIFMIFNAYGTDGFAHAAEGLVGQAIGAKSRRMLDRAVFWSTVAAAILAVGFSLTYWIAGPVFIDLLTSIPEVRAEAKTYLFWTVILPLIGVWSFQLDGIFIGATRSAEMRNTMVVSLLGFVGLTEVFVPLWGNDGLWLAYIGFLSLRTVTMLFYYPAVAGSAGTAFKPAS